MSHVSLLIAGFMDWWIDGFRIVGLLLLDFKVIHLRLYFRIVALSYFSIVALGIYFKVVAAWSISFELIHYQVLILAPCGLIITAASIFSRYFFNSSYLFIIALSTISLISCFPIVIT